MIQTWSTAPSKTILKQKMACYNLELKHYQPFFHLYSMDLLLSLKISFDIFNYKYTNTFILWGSYFRGVKHKSPVLPSSFPLPFSEVTGDSLMCSFVSIYLHTYIYANKNAFNINRRQYTILRLALLFPLNSLIYTRLNIFFWMLIGDFFLFLWTISS